MEQSDVRREVLALFVNGRVDPEAIVSYVVEANARIAELETELADRNHAVADYEHTYSLAMDGQCTDEHGHCECVWALKREVAEIEAQAAGTRHVLQGIYEGTLPGKGGFERCSECGCRDGNHGSDCELVKALSGTAGRAMLEMTEWYADWRNYCIQQIGGNETHQAPVYVDRGQRARRALGREEGK